MSYSLRLYHIVFRTKHSARVLDLEKSEELYKYIWGIIKNKNSYLYRINGMEDHIHILANLHSTISLADFVKSIKASSSKWIKQNNTFSNFTSWGTGYYASSHSMNEKEHLINYIKNQREHHKVVSFKEEISKLWEETFLSKDDKWFWVD